MSPNLKTIAAVSGTFILACACLVMLPMVPSAFNKIARGRLALVRGGISTESFRQLPVNITSKVYVFNITNYHGFLFGGEKPHVKQLGPYTFTSVWIKNMSWDCNQLLYRENRTYYFVPQLSNGSLDDEVYNVDIVYMTLVKLVDTLSPFVQRRLRRFLSFRPVLRKNTVREFLFDGYRDPLAAFAHIFKPDLPTIDGKVGYLLGKNATNDGLYSVYSGSDGQWNRINEISTFQHSPTLVHYKEPCNRLYGTNGELFPPYGSTPPASLAVFSPSFCRPWPLYFNGTTTIAGVESAIYSSGDEMFSSTGNSTLDQCFEKYPVGFKGTFDASACQAGLPIVLSLPHFYKGDPQLIQSVLGLQPDPKKHDFALSVFKFGTPTDLKIRYQLNVPVTAQPATGEGPRFIYPVLWQELIFLDEDRKRLNEIVYKMAVLPQLVIKDVLIGLGVTFFVITALIVSILVVMARKEKRSDEEVLTEDEPKD